MSSREAIIAVLIHLLTPLAGSGCYVWLCRKMKKESVPAPPFLSYFNLFFSFGGWLMVALTLLLWKPSGMFLAGMFYLLFVAPVVTAAMAFCFRQERILSIYHHRAHQISTVYSVVSVVVAAGWFLIHWA